MEKIIQQFFPAAKLISFEELSGGIIHQTYKVILEIDRTKKAFVFQQFNANTFKMPFKVMKNLSLVQAHLSRQNYPLQIAPALPTIHDDFFYQGQDEGLWRVFPFLQNSTSFEIPKEEKHLYQAGKAYGYFLTALKDFDVNQLEITIPDFHNISKRFEDFQKSVDAAPSGRKQKAVAEIQSVLRYYQQFKIDLSTLPIRAVHNDSKLSNLLFDKNTQDCIAVIDLDTLMPGYVVTDFGDMVRGMCNTSTEDEKDLNKVGFNAHHYQLLKKGFLESTASWLTVEEKNNLFNGAIYIILEQAIRFLGDYLDGDHYYTVQYPLHNYDRARNQLKLFASMISSSL